LKRFIPRILGLVDPHARWLRPAYLVERIQSPPADGAMPTGTMLVEYRGPYPKWAHFRCPRCNEHIQVSIAQGKRSWRLRVDALSRPTLRPSIWQLGSCGAHFFITRGRIEWCFDEEVDRDWNTHESPT
jgi:hypothetical protein